MLPHFRVLSYSYFSELDLWISDRFINEFTIASASIERPLKNSLSAILCTNDSYVGCEPELYLESNAVKVHRSDLAVLPTYLELGLSAQSIEDALRQITQSMMVDIFDLNTGRALLKGCFIGGISHKGSLDIADQDAIVRKLVEKK